MNKQSFDFTHKGEPYEVECKEEDRVLYLRYLDSSGVEIGTREIKLLGVIDETQLKQIVIDYWKSFVKHTLKDIGDLE